MNDKLARMGADYLTVWADMQPWTTKKETALEFNEAMMRIYVYDDPKPRDDCDLVQTVIEKRAVHTKYPRVFAFAIVKHITMCDNCYVYHRGMMEDKPT